MGEIADAMLDGTLCEGCGTYIGAGDGFPAYCSSACARDRGVEDYQTSGHRSVDAPNPKKTNCLVCNRRVKIVGLPQHMRDAHGLPG